MPHVYGSRLRCYLELWDIKIWALLDSYYCALFLDNLTRTCQKSMKVCEGSIRESDFLVSDCQRVRGVFLFGIRRKSFGMMSKKDAWS